MPKIEKTIKISYSRRDLVELVRDDVETTNSNYKVKDVLVLVDEVRGVFDRVEVEVTEKEEREPSCRGCPGGCHICRTGPDYR